MAKKTKQRFAIVVVTLNELKKEEKNQIQRSDRKLKLNLTVCERYRSCVFFFPQKSIGQSIEVKYIDGYFKEC